MQVLMIQIWSLLREIEDRYYLMNEFQIVSLYPPVKQNELTNETIGNIGNSANLLKEINKQSGPPAGNFRFVTNHESMNLYIKTGDESKLITRRNSPPSIDFSRSSPDILKESQHLMREKQLPVHGGENLVKQWFDYKNQVEIRVVFVPLLSCRLPTLTNRFS